MPNITPEFTHKFVFRYEFSLPVILRVQLRLLSFRASVRAVFPSLCGVRMDAPEGSFALIGEGRTKSSSDRIRKERTGRARQTAPGERRAFSCHFTLFPPSHRLNRQSSCRKKSEEDPQTTRWRDAAGSEMDFASCSRGFDGAR